MSFYDYYQTFKDHTDPIGHVYFEKAQSAEEVVQNASKADKLTELFLSIVFHPQALETFNENGALVPWSATLLEIADYAIAQQLENTGSFFDDNFMARYFEIKEKIQLMSQTKGKGLTEKAPSKEIVEKTPIVSSIVQTHKRPADRSEDFHNKKPNTAHEPIIESFPTNQDHKRPAETPKDLHNKKPKRDEWVDRPTPKTTLPSKPLSFALPITHSTILPGDQQNPVILEKLTNAQRDTGFALYSSKFSAMAPDFHLHGDFWKPQQLSELFAEGLLRHYFGTETRLNFSKIDKQLAKENLVDKFEFELDFQDRIEFISFLKPKSSKAKDGSRYATLVYRYFSSLQKDYSHPLIQWGGKFQRYKVMTEKLEQKMQEEQKKGTENNKNPYFQLMLKMDAEAERAQIILFHWVRDLCQQLKEFMQPKTVEQVEQQLPYFQPINPSFLKDLKYHIQLETPDELEKQYYQLIQ